MKFKKILVFFCSFSVFSGIASAEKVLSVFHADVTPSIDGKLGDGCWKNADIIGDFTPLYSLPLEPMKVRMVHDDDNLYIGVEVFTKNPQALHRKVADIRSKEKFKEGFVHINEFTNLCSVEIFIDPEATMRNHYQILFNVAEQICGHYKYQWEDVFAVKPYGKAQMTKSGWSAEIVIPRAALNNVAFETGMEWGFNIARNDLLPVSIWKDVGPVFNTPSQFGRMVIGDYKSWWRGAWQEGVMERFEEISAEIKQKGDTRPDVYNMYREVRAQIWKEKLHRHNLSNRSGFLKAYRRYSDFYPLFHRFDAYYRTYRSMR